MKVTGPGQIKTSSTRKSEKRAGGGAAFSAAIPSGEGREVSSSGQTAKAVPLTPIDALLSLQEAPDARSGKSKGLARASDMLDMLEDVRRGILLGSVSPVKLRQLANLARNRREDFTDPALAAILDDIELRAEVEIAKLESKI